MTIIARASVPSHLNLREADTGVIRTVPTLTEQIRELAGRGLSRDEINEQLAAIVAHRPPMPTERRTEIDAWVTTAPVAEMAATLGIGLDTAERIRTLFTTSGATITPCPAWCELQGQHLVDEHEHPDDRAHFSVAGEVFCTLEQPAGEQPPRAWAALVQHDFDQQPRINAFLGAGHPIDMTPTEARQYAALLIELADRAEQTGTDQ